MNSMLTLEEVKNYLGVPQDDLEKMIQSGKLNAYKIGGAYIRFRKEEVLQLKHDGDASQSSGGGGFLSKAGDFWRFNNFYILSLGLVAILIYLILMR